MAYNTAPTITAVVVAIAGMRPSPVSGTVSARTSRIVHTNAAMRAAFLLYRLAFLSLQRPVSAPAVFVLVGPGFHTGRSPCKLWVA